VAICFGVVCWKLGKLVWKESFEFIGSMCYCIFEDS
jgi:hypothetical protein